MASPLRRKDAKKSKNFIHKDHEENLKTFQKTASEHFKTIKLIIKTILRLTHETAFPCDFAPIAALHEILF